MGTIQPGAIMSFYDMCKEEGGASLQRGMYFRMHGTTNIFLMNRLPDAPYSDRVEENGKVLIYEGHDVDKRSGHNPKTVDQPMNNPSGSLSRNGLFYEAAMRTKEGVDQPEIVKVYEKIRRGMWTYNGLFRLMDSWQETSNSRKVFKFRLEVSDKIQSNKQGGIEQTRLIPGAVKLKVWERDQGRCVICKATDNLHFDHIIPLSKGGSSLVSENIQIMCARHNLQKHDKISA